MGITKVASDSQSYRREAFSFGSARAAFRSFLEALRFQEGEQVMLPAYIGWSPREGSGVFDPVRESGIAYRFYRMTERLQIDLSHLETCLKEGRVKAVVLIHYFGYVDPAYEEAVALARRYGAVVLEDEAHALYTDLIGGACGRLGDACILSLHKMLPVADGGLLIINPTGRLTAAQIEAPSCTAPSPWLYDLYTIARRRFHNARLLTELLASVAGTVEPLWGMPGAGIFPQTYPVLVHGVSRDQLYHLMNERGFGAVSLYHTMVAEIQPFEFPESYWLAKCIFNLPVHQDAEPADLAAMVTCLRECIDQLQKMTE